MATTRERLKYYFRKYALPTEQQYAAQQTAHHQHRRHVGLAALRLARQSHQLAPRQTGRAKQREQELHRRQLHVARDAHLLQAQHQRTHRRRLACMSNLSIQLS